MVLNRIIWRTLKEFKRKYGTSAKPKVECDQTVFSNLVNSVYKPRHHPGIIKPKSVSLPVHIVQTIEHIIQDHPMKLLSTDSDALARHLKGRVPPMEIYQFNETKQKIVERVLMKEKQIEINDEADQLQFKQKIKDKVDKLLKEKVYNWSPIKYDTYKSLLYLFARSAPDYAVLVKIFSEISMRDVDFKPRSLFDFGSGVGAVTWAAELFWKEDFFEKFNVDISGEMNDLAQTILRKGQAQPANIKGVFYRQFLPANNITYDLVVSAYSMLELPSFQTRMETVLTLWNKTNKYLVIVEQGTNAGFKIINEIRDFLLHLKDDKNPAHVFSPCPHDSPCPRFLNDDTPCNFEVGYTKPFGRNNKLEKERYSYLVLKRGKRNETTQEWPRVVRDTLVRSKHTICRMCTSKGNLTEVIFTASKHGKNMYHCARATQWGDRLPITLKDSNDATIELELEKEKDTV